MSSTPRRSPPRKRSLIVHGIKPISASVTTGMAAGVRAALAAMKLDVKTEPEFDALDLPGTPERVARMWAEMLSGYVDPPPRLHLTPAEGRRELVVETSIAFTSMCAHHMVPFSGHAAIGYLPGDHLIGLSKLVRVLDHFAKRFQLQERLGAQVADYIVHEAEASAAFVMLRAEHQCIACRGVRRPGVQTVTSSFRPHGTPRHLVDEFYRLVEHGERK